ncbi:F-box/kelch-repeat protein At3g06240 [Medicago truncatula]|nr:F-box/kelch-repeat protein At3g06240 [Medicago truncatula]
MVSGIVSYANEHLGQEVISPEQLYVALLHVREQIAPATPSSGMNMVKLVPARNNKVRNYIPDDLTQSILSNLSLKSLNRFRCVRKSWSTLFENPSFISLLRNNFLFNNHDYYEDTSLLLHQIVTDDEFVLYSLSGERFEIGTKIDWPNPFEENKPNFDISGSCSINGILCLINYSEPNTRAVLWNPTTQEFKVIPTSPFEFVPHMDVDILRHGFGYDCVTNDYKIIRQVMCYHKIDIDVYLLEDIDNDHFWEIYSLRSNSWRKLEYDIPINHKESGVCLDGMVHWWNQSDDIGDEDDEDDDDDEAYLLSFDLRTEEFITTLTPLEDVSFDSGYVLSDLMVLNGSIALISNYTNLGSFQIYVLGEFGVKESWFKLFIFQPLSIIVYPIGAGRKGNIFFTNEDGKLIFFSLSTMIIEEFNFVRGKFSGKTITYKESLLPIGEINE